MATSNPYAAPTAIVDDVRERDTDDDNFTIDGVEVPAGNGLDWVKLAWSMYKLQPLTWIGMMLVFVILSAVMQIIPILGPLAGAVLTPVFMGGIMLGCLALDDGDRLGVGHLFEGFRQRFGQLALLGLVQLGVFFALGIVVALMGMGMGRPGIGMVVAGLVALVVMFVMFSAMWFAPALVTVNELPAMQALRASFLVSLKNWKAMLVYGLVLFLFGAGLMAVFGIVFGGAIFGAAKGAAGFAAIGTAVIGGLVMMFAAAAILGPIVIASMYTAYVDVFHER